MSTNFNAVMCLHIIRQTNKAKTRPFSLIDILWHPPWKRKLSRMWEMIIILKQNKISTVYYTLKNQE